MFILYVHFVSKESISLPTKGERKNVFNESTNTSVWPVTPKDRDSRGESDLLPPIIPEEVACLSQITPAGLHACSSLMPH